MNQVALQMDRVIQEPIEEGATRRVVIDLPCGLFHSHYLLPISRFPLELTLELASADAVAMKGPLSYAGADVAATSHHGQVQHPRTCDSSAIRFSSTGP
jgi:hypothetical protein